MAKDAALLTLDMEHTGETVVVRCHGRLVAGVCDELYHDVKNMLPGTRRVVLDLTELTQMDSLGLGTVVRLYVTARGSGCTLKLINLGQRVRDLLGMTHLLHVLTEMGEHGVAVKF
ncbi:MAG TPA: STAS domain-containing protein [Terracidiphilus sp.]|nr:STAS domain-containing protein [Terracidiphilus sp.]